MKFDLLLWVINVLNLKFEWTALSSEHWGNHFSIIKNKTNHHPLFLSSPSFGIPMFSPALQNLGAIFNVSLEIPSCVWQGHSPTRTNYCFSSHCAPGLHWGMASHLPWLLTLFVRLFVCSRIPFQHTHWWKEYSAPSGFQSCFSPTCLPTSNIYTSQSGGSLNATLPAAPHHPGTSQHSGIFTTKVLPILMLVCLDSVPSGPSLSRVARWNWVWVSLAYPTACQLCPTIKSSIKGIRVPAQPSDTHARSLRPSRIVFLALITHIRGKGIFNWMKTK